MVELADTLRKNRLRNAKATPNEVAGLAWFVRPTEIVHAQTSAM